MQEKIINRVNDFTSILGSSFSFSNEKLNATSASVTSASLVGSYSKDQMNCFDYVLKRINNVELIDTGGSPMINEEVNVKVRTLTPSGYINFWLITIATIFLSLLCIVLGFQILGY